MNKIVIQDNRKCLKDIVIPMNEMKNMQMGEIVSGPYDGVLVMKFPSSDFDCGDQFFVTNLTEYEKGHHDGWNVEKHGEDCPHMVKILNSTVTFTIIPD